MRFQNVNELGEITRVDNHVHLFRFEYTNGFYGSCTFLAEVRAGERGVLALEEESLSVEAYTLKQGTLSILLKLAKLFFKRKLAKYTQLTELRNDPVLP